MVNMIAKSSVMVNSESATLSGVPCQDSVISPQQHKLVQTNTNKLINTTADFMAE